MWNWGFDQNYEISKRGGPTSQAKKQGDLNYKLEIIGYQNYNLDLQFWMIIIIMNYWNHGVVLM